MFGHNVQTLCIWMVLAQPQVARTSVHFELEFAFLKDSLEPNDFHFVMGANWKLGPLIYNEISIINSPVAWPSSLLPSTV